MGIRYFSRFVFKMSVIQLFYIATAPKYIYFLIFRFTELKIQLLRRLSSLPETPTPLSLSLSERKASLRRRRSRQSVAKSQEIERQKKPTALITEEAVEEGNVSIETLAWWRHQINWLILFIIVTRMIHFTSYMMQVNTAYPALLGLFVTVNIRA